MLLAEKLARLFKSGIAHFMLGRKFNAKVIHGRFVGLHGRRPLSYLEVGGHRFREPRLDCQRIVRVPLDLRGPQSCLNQNSKLIQFARNGSIEAHVVEQIEKTLAHHWAAKHGIIWAGNSDARNFQNLIGERPLLIVQLL